MKTIMKTTILATSLVLALAACSEKKDDSAEKTRVHADATMKSDELADAGEQLVSPYTFMLSDRVFDMALEKNPDNKKAQFYKNFVKRLMVLKGIGRRIAPMMRQGSQEQIAGYEKWKREFPNSPLKTFLLDGPEDISSYSQLVDVLHDYNLALNDFRKFLKLNAGIQLTLNLNPHIFGKTIDEELAQSCVAVDGPDNSVTVECAYSGIAQKQVNAADLIALRQITSGEILYWSMMTSYELSTIEQIGRNPLVEKMTPQERLAYYKTFPSIAKLRTDNTLTLIPEIGSDFSAAMKWAKQYQANICPKGVNAKNQRRGFLFKDGVCIKHIQDTDKGLALLDQALSGVFTTPIKNDQDQTVDQIRVNLVGFLKNPPADLKNILPDEVNEKGEATRWTDNTIGGLFPDGDVHKLNKNKN